jgi:hypothetical protein
MKAVERPDPPGAHQYDAVELERVHGCPANSCPADDAGRRRAPPEVVLPLLGTGVEEGNQATCPRIYCFDLCFLGIVAPEAAEAEVLQVICAAEHSRYNVVDGEIVARQQRRGAAVRTKLSGARSNPRSP